VVRKPDQLGRSHNSKVLQASSSRRAGRLSETSHKVTFGPVETVAGVLKRPSLLPIRRSSAVKTQTESDQTRVAPPEDTIRSVVSELDQLSKGGNVDQYHALVRANLTMLAGAVSTISDSLSRSVKRHLVIYFRYVPELSRTDDAIMKTLPEDVRKVLWRAAPARRHIAGQLLAVASRREVYRTKFGDPIKALAGLLSEDADASIEEWERISKAPHG
jgi:hypothetical protein